MVLILVPAAALLVASLLITAAVRGARRVVTGRRPTASWRRVLCWHAPLAMLYLFVGAPLLIGYLGVSRIGTRGDERAYVGPCFDASGVWQPQVRGAIREVPDPGGRFVEARMFDGAGGQRLRTFLVSPPKDSPRSLTAVLVHGLFRSALEVDPVAKMFHELGCEVAIVETRNHGGSDRGPSTFGERESRDLVAVIDALRARPSARDRRIVLFGVSLGSAVAALAAPELEGLAALVLDAPMAALDETADRVLDVRLGMPQPFRSMTLASIAFWADIELESVRPIEALSRLSPQLPTLIIGGTQDRRMPPEVVRACHDALPAAAGCKELWLREGSGHGSVWSDDPAGYRARLRALLDRIR